MQRPEIREERKHPRRAALADWLQERGALEGMVAHADSPKEMAAYLRKRGLLEGFIERARSIGAWGDWNGPKNGITEEQVEALLAPHGIHPRIKKRPDGTVEKFYAREQFEEAWKALGMGDGKPS
jgi:hypothetical protein